MHLSKLKKALAIFMDLRRQEGPLFLVLHGASQDMMYVVAPFPEVPC